MAEAAHGDLALGGSGMGRGDRRGLAGAPARLMQGVWRVFATYIAAVAGIFAASGMAIVTLKSMFPDTPDQALLQSLPALIAGSLASSFALIFTLLAIEIGRAHV